MVTNNPPAIDLAAIERQQRDQRRQRGRGWAPSAPMPSDPKTCRWCGGRRKTLANDVDYCDRGCAPNDQEPYTGHCEECGRQFATGHPRPDLCHGCTEREQRMLRGDLYWQDSRKAQLRERLGVSGDVDE